jgi:hypothetical protein
MSFIPPRTWATILHLNRHRQIFIQGVERMVAPNKVRQHERSGDWHDDRYQIQKR